MHQSAGQFQSIRRTIFRLAIAAGLACTYALGQQTTEAADPVLTAEEAYGYSGIRAENDLLIVARVGVVEDEDDEYGVYGAILSVEDNHALYSRAHPSTIGQSVRSWYWLAPSNAKVASCRVADCTNSRPSFQSALDLEVCISLNPTIGTTQHCIDITWRVTADSDAAVTQLTKDVKEILTQAETDDARINSGTYVQSGYITIPGRVLLQSGGGGLQDLVNQADYTITQSGAGIEWEGGTLAIPTPEASIGLQGGSASDYATEISTPFGIPSYITSVLAILGAGVGLYYVANLSGSSRAVLLYPFPIVLFGSIVGFPPLMAVIGMTVLTAMLAFGVVVTRYWPS